MRVMPMRIYVEHFKSNKGKPLDYYVQNIRAGVTEEGVINVCFNTREKYYSVDARTSIFTSKYEGQAIDILSMVHKDPIDEDPEFFSITLCVECSGSYQRIVTPLKHHYFVSFIPSHMVINYDCLEEPEIINSTEGDA